MLERVSCRGCGKAVYFVKDQNGKTQILDAVAPVWRVIINGYDGDKVQYVAERAPEQTFVTHFSTCAQANQFSKSKKEVSVNAQVCLK